MDRSDLRLKKQYAALFDWFKRNLDYESVSREYTEVQN